MCRTFNTCVALMMSCLHSALHNSPYCAIQAHTRLCMNKEQSPRARSGSPPNDYHLPSVHINCSVNYVLSACNCYIIINDVQPCSQVNALQDKSCNHMYHEFDRSLMGRPSACTGLTTYSWTYAVVI